MATLRDIYQALAGLSVTVGVQTIPAKALEDLPDTVNTADLPLRILVPTANPGTEAVEFGNLGIGRGAEATVVWRIGDLLLYKSVMQDTGLGVAAPFLVDYIQAYLDALRADRTLGLTGVLVQGATASAGVFEWPANSGQWYYGLQVTVTVQAHLT